MSITLQPKNPGISDYKIIAPDTFWETVKLLIAENRSAYPRVCLLPFEKNGEKHLLEVKIMLLNPLSKGTEKRSKSDNFIMEMPIEKPKTK